MRILITGAGGYIGSWLAAQSVTDGHAVVLIDPFRRVSPDHPWLRRHKKQVTVIQSDLLSLAERDKTKIKRTDWLFHCAGRGKIPQSYEDPVGYHHANVTATIHALELARTLGIKRFVYPMTSAGFYQPKRIPIAETEEIQCPAPYTLTKYLGERAVMHWSKVYGIGGVSLRLFHVYGPPSPLGVVAYSRISAALQAKQEHRPFIIDGDGSYTQDFVHIKDVCAAFVAAAESNLKGEIFHIATGVETSINDLARRVGVVTQTNGLPYKSPYRGVADISKVQKLLRWKPQITIKQGIEELLSTN